MKQQCDWGTMSDLMRKYHDSEWGVPVHEDKKLFEFLILDGFQAGLSWSTILNKRENFRRAFLKFDARKIARFDKRKQKVLLGNTGIIRNRLKILASIKNSKAFLKIQTEFGSFDKYIWQFVGHKQKINTWKKMSHIPAKTKQSDAMSKDLKKRGFTFVGSTICYAFMQAAGLVNDHITTCFRYKQVMK